MKLAFNTIKFYTSFISTDSPTWMAMRKQFNCFTNYNSVSTFVNKIKVLTRVLLTKQFNCFTNYNSASTFVLTRVLLTKHFLLQMTVK